MGETTRPARYDLNQRESESRSVVSDSLRPHGLSPWNSTGQNTGVDSLSLLQGIFPTQESNPGLPHCRQILYQLSHKGSPTPYKESDTTEGLHFSLQVSEEAGLVFLLSYSVVVSVVMSLRSTKGRLTKG